MSLTRPWKITIGLATLWLALYPLLFFAVWLLMFVGVPLLAALTSSNESFPIAVPAFVLPMFCIIPLHFATILIGLGLIAFYLVHIIKNTKANETVRILLGVGCFMIPFIAMPVYYYAYIWLDEPPAWAIAPLTPNTP